MTKIVCIKCGEIPIPLNVPKAVEESETELMKFEQKILGGAKCARCGGDVKLIRGELISTKAIAESKRIEGLFKSYTDSVDVDTFLHKSNEVVIDKILADMKTLTKIFLHKNILFYVLVGENSPEGCIVYNTKTMYSGIYTMFPEVKKVLLKNSLDSIKKSCYQDAIPTKNMNRLFDLEKDNKKLKFQVKKQQQQIKDFELKISNQHSEMFKKQKEIEHFKELYNKLKNLGVSYDPADKY